ncbi:hypothetical protein IQ249_04830 [Lusitaniella coriacea LEGE 07157]|uniref:Cell division protein FtsL n=1 Tax=Lusitaniella coriacea LEGE 07157 TaxID=945747 RepID=A0A8J7DUZ0_9CYAN|nr:hypothetical protein [Lusitaniella coriacea]MBE9115220.1 hypothetical protein [Lusitaniella coriacea LEGE 07157]
MSPSPKNLATPRRRRLRKPIAPEPLRRTPATRNSSLRHPTPHPARKVERLPLRSPQQPPLLRTLLFLQHASSFVTFSLFGVVLCIYASTVYLQQQWSEAYQKLENLQRETRNLTAADEILKNQLAKQAQNPDAGLVMPSPDNNIYLSPSTQTSTPEPAASPKPETPQPSNVPLGY